MDDMLNKNLQSFLHYQKALAFSEDNLLAKALEEIDKAILVENRPAYKLGKAKILAQTGNYQEALNLLKDLPDSSSEKAEAEMVIKRIRRLQKPFGLILYTMKASKAVRNLIYLLFGAILVVSALLYFSKKQEDRLTQNLDILYQETKDISLQLNKLTTHLESRDLVGRNDLYLQKNMILDSVRLQIIQLEDRFTHLERRIDRVNTGLTGTSSEINSKLDTLQMNINYLLDSNKD